MPSPFMSAMWIRWALSGIAVVMFFFVGSGSVKQSKLNDPIWEVERHTLHLSELLLWNAKSARPSPLKSPTRKSKAAHGELYGWSAPGTRTGPEQTKAVPFQEQNFHVCTPCESAPK